MLPGQHHPAVEHIVVNAAVGKPGELMREIRHTDSERTGKVFHADWLRVVVIDIIQNLLDNAAAEGLTLHRVSLAHRPADQIHQADHEGVVTITLKWIAFMGLVVPDPVNAGDKGFCVLIAELPGTGAAGMLPEKVLRIDLPTAQPAHDFRREIQIGALIVFHLAGAGEPVHTERRQYEQLIGEKGIQTVFHPHELSAAQVNIKLKVVMTVELRDLKSFIQIVVRFVTLVSRLIHGEKRCLRFIRLHRCCLRYELCSICIQYNTICV